MLRIRRKGLGVKSDSFKEYLKESEPDKANKSYAWSTAIGLQAVDGLKPSEYLVKTAIQNIEGEITIKEAQSLIDSYYAEKTDEPVDENRIEEADKVSARIAALLSEDAFSFSPNEYISIHRKLFTGIYSHAGKLRDYNITKKEWVLDGATVLYGTASELKETLEYDFSQERNFSYRGMSTEDIIHHLAVFVSRLWQIHIFAEGNTRTTAVFFIKYLRTLGFSATNDIFAEHAWYFRNALVRANYNNLQEGIHETTEYLEKFLKNLLLDEHNPLSNREMHISGYWKQGNNKKPDVQTIKPDVESAKPDIQTIKPDIQLIDNEFSAKTKKHILTMHEQFGRESFTRSKVSELLDLRTSAASELIKKLLTAGIIEKITGFGKGQYRFRT